MSAYEEQKASDVLEEAEPVFETPKTEEWEILIERGVLAIELRRVTKQSRGSKPITFSSPSLWTLSGSADER